MAKDTDIFNRIDSLMRPEGVKPPGPSPLGEPPSPALPLAGKRRRTFVAAQESGTPEKEFVAQPSRGLSLMPKLEEIDFTATLAVEDDDLPVLTEVVPPEAAVSENSPDRSEDILLSTLIADITHAIEQQMAIELPMLVEASLLTATNELRAGISASMGLALRDFLTRRRQLRLPLNEPNSDG